MPKRVGEWSRSFVEGESAEKIEEWAVVVRLAENWSRRIEVFRFLVDCISGWNQLRAGLRVLEF